MEVNNIAVDVIHKLRLDVVFRIIAAAVESPEERQVTGLPKRCSQITDDITVLISSLQRYDLIV